MTNIQNAYLQLNDWIEKSQGNPITIGENINCAFLRKRTFTKADFINIDLHYPAQYIDFLINVGEVELFIEHGLGIEFSGIDKIQAFSNLVFENYGDDLYPELLLAISLPALGYFGGFYQGIHSDHNFSIFYPDVPPEMWIEEADFMDFNDWIIFLVHTKNQKGIYAS